MLYVLGYSNCACNTQWTVFSSWTGPSTEPSVVESKDRKANAHLILKLMCDSVVLRPHLRELLSAKYDALFPTGHTYKKTLLLHIRLSWFIHYSFFICLAVSLKYFLYNIVAVFLTGTPVEWPHSCWQLVGEPIQQPSLCWRLLRKWPRVS